MKYKIKDEKGVPCCEASINRKSVQQYLVSPAACTRVTAPYIALRTHPLSQQQWLLCVADAVRNTFFFTCFPLEVPKGLNASLHTRLQRNLYWFSYLEVFCYLFVYRTRDVKNGPKLKGALRHARSMGIIIPLIMLHVLPRRLVMSHSCLTRKTCVNAYKAESLTLRLVLLRLPDVARQVHLKHRGPRGWLLSGWIGRRRDGTSPGRGEGRASLHLLRPPPGMPDAQYQNGVRLLP